MESDLKEYRSKLERAIHEALTESPAINSVICKIQESGYDVFLIVEATEGFDRPEEDEKPEREASTVRLKLTSQDQRFLRQLKISPE